MVKKIHFVSENLKPNVKNSINYIVIELDLDLKNTVITESDDFITLYIEDDVYRAQKLKIIDIIDFCIKEYQPQINIVIVPKSANKSRNEFVIEDINEW